MIQELVTVFQIYMSRNSELTFKCRQALTLELCKEGSSEAGEERETQLRLLD